MMKIVRGYNTTAVSSTLRRTGNSWILSDRNKTLWSVFVEHLIILSARLSKTNFFLSLSLALETFTTVYDNIHDSFQRMIDFFLFTLGSVLKRVLLPHEFYRWAGSSRLIRRAVYQRIIFYGECWKVRFRLVFYVESSGFCCRSFRTRFRISPLT